jgi:integrase
VDKEELRKEQIRRSRRKLVEVRRVLTVDGQTLEKSFYGRTREEALQALEDFLNPPLQVAGEPVGIPAVPENTVAWWFLVKYAPLKAHLRKSTRDNLQNAARHLLPEVGRMMVWDLKATDLTAALARIAEKRTLRNPNAKPKEVRQADGLVKVVDPKPIYKPLSASIVNRCRQVALEVNALAAEELPDKVRKINPKRVPRRQEPDREVDIYTPTMMRALLEVAKDTSAYVPILLWGFLGLRLNEGLGALGGDLTPDAVLEVRHQDKDGVVTTQLKTPSARRDIPLPAGLYEALKKFQTENPTDRLARTRADTPLSEKGAAEALYKAMRRTGLPRTTPHGLRHSFSTWLDENGCPRSVRLALMGHSRKAVNDRYNHPSMRKLLEWMTKLWEASFGPYDGPVSQPAARTERNRSTYASGERNGRSVLTARVVVEVVRPRLEKGDSPYRIARDLKVATRTIEKIRDGITWRDTR